MSDEFSASEAQRDDSQPPGPAVTAVKDDLDLGIVESWRKRLLEAQTAHDRAADGFERSNLALGAVVTVLSACSASLIFLNMSDDPTWREVLAAFGSLFASIGAAVLTYLRLPKSVDSHATAAKEFGALARQCELLERFPPASDADLREEMRRFEESWRRLNVDTPRASRFPWPR